MSSKEYQLRKHQGLLTILLLACGLYGLQIMMVIPISLGQTTTPFSIVFRGFMLILSLRLIYLGVGKTQKQRMPLVGYVWISFWIIYLLRVIYDLEFQEVHLLSSIYEKQKTFIYQFAIGATFIPIIAIIMNAKYVDSKQALKILFRFSFINTLAVLYITYKLLGSLSAEFLSSRDALSVGISESAGGMPINPIIVSMSGSSLFLSSVLVLLFLDVRKKSAKIFYIMCILLGTITLFLGSSRGPMIGGVVTLLLAVFFYINNVDFDIRKTGAIIIIFFIGITVLISYIDRIGVNLDMIDRLTQTVEDQKTGKGEARNELLETAFHQFLDNPITGDQIFERIDYSYPHNVVLEALMSTGLLGGIPFIISILVVLYNGIRVFLQKSDYAPIYLLAFFQLMLGLTSSSLFSSPELWLPFSFVLVMNVRSPNYQSV